MCIILGHIAPSFFVAVRNTELKDHTGDDTTILTLCPLHTCPNNMSSRSRRSRSPRFKRRQSVVQESAGIEDDSPDPIPSPPSKFDQLLELIKTQIGLLTEQSRALYAQKEEIKAELRAQLHTMNKHTTMLQALETDATKDDKAYEGRALGDAQTWNALDKETLAKIKVVVEQWRDVMQISLVFIALFLTVVTAFISPVIQIFTTPSDSSSPKMRLPSVPTQLVALFYYLALITSHPQISNAVLCVLGMQWGARLIATPLGKTNLERALARERRMLSAEGKMRSLMGVLVWTLLISIGFFVLGFLIQLWDLTFSFAGSAPILIVGGVFATGLSLVILGIIIVTTLHAALNDNSPFESPLSNAMKPMLRWIRRRVRQQEPGTPYDDGKNGSTEINGSRDGDDVGALIQWKKDDGTDILALKTYAQLVLNTNDEEVLERAVPSFEIGQWYAARDSLLPVFHAVRERFLATDTSFRVKETVLKQVAYLKDWGGWEVQIYWRASKANDFTRWCRTQCVELINGANGLRRSDFFPSFALFASLEEDNLGLERWASYAPEKCIAHILCTFNSDGELGEREDIFASAVNVCARLLKEGRTDEVTAIVSHVPRASILQSFIRRPDKWWDGMRDLVTFITKGKEVEVLDEMSFFFSHLPEMSVVDAGREPLLVFEFLQGLISGSPTGFTVPPSFDLSSVLGLVHQNSLFEHYSISLINYLDQRGGFNNLSDLHAALRLWEYCRDEHSAFLEYCRDERSAVWPSDEDITFYQDYSPCFIGEGCLVSRNLTLTVCLALPELIDEKCDGLVQKMCDLIALRDNISIDAKVLKAPILDLVNLDHDQSHAVVSKILSEVQRSDFVTLMIMESCLPWTRIQNIVSYLTAGYELELLTAMSDSGQLEFPSHAMSGLLDFLGHIAHSLPSDFSVSPYLDLSEVLDHVVCKQRKRQTWRNHSNTIMFYFDHGALDNIQRFYLRSATHFFYLCTVDSQKMKGWTDEERTSEHTRQRAMSYLREFNVRAPDDEWLAEHLNLWFPEGLDPLPPIITDEPQLSPTKTAWTFPFRKWRDRFWKAPRSTQLPDRGPDIELGTIGGLDLARISPDDG
ncbi:hypothetical protein SISNIDRAFT_468030 [Sistotremastrum niveocremeum HHB9708]|uniref:DUF6535 domain-containing protein n=1 Tax=Sistotremastrum niveocremeum HHB9708 TaxID=1314777 RepID=A0A164S2R5_9AGAM|nr:hypothetical protein SISNIDRAFT_468030 [Sistotremastrum niveocremeum HHB9708]